MGKKVLEPEAYPREVRATGRPRVVTASGLSDSSIGRLGNRLDSDAGAERHRRRSACHVRRSVLGRGKGGAPENVGRQGRHGLQLRLRERSPPMDAPNQAVVSRAAIIADVTATLR